MGLRKAAGGGRGAGVKAPVTGGWRVGGSGGRGGCAGGRVSCQRHLAFVWGSGEPEKALGWAGPCQTFSQGPSVVVDGRGEAARGLWLEWSRGCSRMGMGAEWGQRTEEEPAQTETRQQLCFGVLSFWPCSLPTWSQGCSQAAPRDCAPGAVLSHLREAQGASPGLLS